MTRRTRPSDDGRPGGGRRAASLGVVALATLLALSLASGTVLAVQTGAMSVERVESAPDSTVAVDVAIDAANVSSYQVELSYDPGVVEVDDVDGVDFADPVTNVDDEAGTVRFTQTNVEGVDDPTVARLRLSVVGSPGANTTMAVNESATKAFDVGNDRIRLESVTAGSVTVDGGTATPAETAAATVEARQSTQFSLGAGVLSGPVAVAGVVLLGGLVFFAGFAAARRL